MSSDVITWDPSVRPIGSCHVAMGVFDGVHVGHRTLIEDCISGARAVGLLAGVVTFDRDPDLVVTPDTAAAQLLSLRDKLDLISALGVDFILVIPFDTAIAALPPERFIDDVLLASTDPMLIHVGQDFRFGRYAEGDVAALRDLGSSRGFEVADRSLVTVNGEPVTSTRIRQLVSEGRVEEAARLLGRPHRVRALVGHGRGAGAEIGVPTANLHPVERAAVPRDGVYAGRALTGDDTYAAGISVGVPPTFTDAYDDLEAHLIGFDGDLYGSEVTIEFLQRIRDQRRFDGEASLVRAIRHDLEAVTRIAKSAD